MLEKFKFSEQKLGFTLAEVLITLGIIGVVAALTIPALISSYHKTVIENRLKDSYSLLNNMIKASSVDNGSPETWDYTLSRDAFVAKYFLPYIKSTDSSSNPGYAYYAQGSSSVNLVNGMLNSKLYYLINGTAFIFKSNVVGRRKAIFFVLLNPNNEHKVFGKDVFMFNFIVDDDGYYLVTSTQDYATGRYNFCGTYSNAGGVNSAVANCDGADTSNPAGVGFSTCTQMIECNGWKIPDYYPINF